MLSKCVCKYCLDTVGRNFLGRQLQALCMGAQVSMVIRTTYCKLDRGHAGPCWCDLAPITDRDPGDEG